MRTTNNLTNSILKGTFPVLIIMASLGSSFAQGSIKAQSFDQNNFGEQRKMRISTEDFLYPNYSNHVILMEDNYNGHFVSSYIEDNSLEKQAIKISKSNYENLGDYLLWASGLKLPFNMNDESSAIHTEQADCESAEDFLISAAHLQAYKSADRSEDDANSEANTSSSLEQFLIKAAGFNTQVATEDDLSSAYVSLEQFLINASQVKEAFPNTKTESAQELRYSENSNLEQFLIQAAGLQEEIADQK